MIMSFIKKLNFIETREINESPYWRRFLLKKFGAYTSHEGCHYSVDVNLKLILFKVASNVKHRTVERCFNFIQFTLHK